MTAALAYCYTPWKDRFDTKNDARRVLKDMQRRSRNSKRNAAPLAEYKCNCGGWHLADSKRVHAYR
ncbi:hypothetical protein [Mycobacterium sp. AZCC_0083]|uniref:hypothetical protein n=1 Tax=Mycobacterium sp. AZCC_0083 TaxID=2735882 RepID=UPI00160D2319|nr:hypothetical protein [Mycobacterium sp. AZCC_0083]MBB5167104.1 hypothetical protein [Mycobacterium sp. AZCC_0083]